MPSSAPFKFKKDENEGNKSNSFTSKAWFSKNEVGTHVNEPLPTSVGSLN